MPKISYIQQRDAMDCGPTCLAMVCRFYGKNFAVQGLREKAEIGKDGVNMLGISQAAESIGYRTQAVQLSVEELSTMARLPCILHWDQNHFVVLYKARKNKFIIADPGKSVLTIGEKNSLSTGPVIWLMASRWALH
jgi:ATP-binding cassette, subfamily B, bacterial